VKEQFSLETPIGDEEDSHLGDLIEDKNTIQPIDAVLQSSDRNQPRRSPSPAIPVASPMLAALPGLCLRQAPAQSRQRPR